MIDIEPDAVEDECVNAYAGLKLYIVGLLDGPVDGVAWEGLEPDVCPVATAHALHAF